MNHGKEEYHVSRVRILHSCWSLRIADNINIEKVLIVCPRELRKGAQIIDRHTKIIDHLYRFLMPRILSWLKADRRRSYMNVCVVAVPPGNDYGSET